MIFVTAGAQVPFDRLVRIVDEWAARTARDDVVAQITPEGWRPRHIAWCEHLDSAAFRRRVSEASCVIAHAGMGTVLTAMELGTPLLVMPRRGRLGETRNDHQVATAEHLRQSGQVGVAMDEHELLSWLDRLHELPAPRPIAGHASFGLLATLRQFIHQEDTETLEPADAPAGVIAPFAERDHGRGAKAA